MSGETGTISGVSLTLSDIHMPELDDLSVLLVSPTGEEFVPLRGAGGTTQTTALTLTLEDSAAAAIPEAAGPASGTYTCRPTSYGTGALTFPDAPAGSYSYPQSEGSASFASVFAGQSANGTWTLYVSNDGTTPGSVTGGWSLTVTDPPATGTTITVTAPTEPVGTTVGVSLVVGSGTLPVATFKYATPAASSALPETGSGGT